MKTLIAMSLAVLLLLGAGYFMTTTVTEKISQTCSTGEANYQNSWRDVYLVSEWFPNRDDGRNFLHCVGPSEYIRYHPYDIALASLLGAAVVGFIAYRSETMYTKKPKQKEGAR